MGQKMSLADVVSFEVIAERGYPFFCGVLAATAIFAVSPDFFCYASAHGWKLEELYLASFDFSSVTTSFLFAFYAFVVTAERGFIAKMKSSIYFAQLITYTVRALILGVVLAVASLPMMVIQPVPQARWDTATIEVAAWVFVVVWTVAAFVRAARLFIAFVSVQE